MTSFSQKYIFRKAADTDKEKIWEILQQAILRRRNERSNQWQDGYPNISTIETDLEKGYGYILEFDGKIAGYSAAIFETEPAYEILEGKWLNSDDYVVIHRVAVANEFTGNGIATKIFLEIEDLAKSKGVFSIKVDTNLDNIPMLKILEKLGYIYCGEVYFRGSARRAFQKILK